MADAGLVFLETEGPRTEAQSKEQETMCKGEMTLILGIASPGRERAGDSLTAIFTAMWNYYRVGDYSASLEGYTREKQNNPALRAARFIRGYRHCSSPNHKRLAHQSVSKAVASSSSKAYFHCNFLHEPFLVFPPEKSWVCNPTCFCLFHPFHIWTLVVVHP